MALEICTAIEALVGHYALGIHGNGNPDMGQTGLVVLLADVKVVSTEAGGGVYAAGTGIQGNMVAAEHHGLLIHQRMLRRHQLQLAVRAARQ